MNYGGKVCTILNNVLQKVTILLLTMFTILPEPHQKSGRTLIIYCTFCKYVIVICRSYTSRPTCYYVLVFFILHHDVRMYDFFYGPTVPEINYSILFYSIRQAISTATTRLPPPAAMIARWLRVEMEN